MKRSALQCIAGFVGAILIIVGVVWTCKQLSSPTQLNAAQDKTSTSLSDTPTQRHSFSSPPKNDVRSNKNGAIGNVSLETPASVNYSDRNVHTPASPVSSLEILTPSSNTSEPSRDDENNCSAGEDETFVSEPEDFPTISSLSLLSSDDDDEIDMPIPLPSPANLQGEFTEGDKNDAIPPSLPTSSLSLQALDEEPGVPSPEDVLPPDSADEFQMQPDALTITEKLDQPQSTSGNINNSSKTQLHLETTPTPVPSVSIEKMSADSNVQSSRTGNLLDYLLSALSTERRPKDSSLEGPQNGQVTIEKLVSAEVQTMKPTLITIKVKNNGSKALKNILLHDNLPENVEFSNAADQTVFPSQNGTLVWPAFDLDPQSEKVFEYTVVPIKEGEIGSVATLIIPVTASCKIKSTQPELKVEVKAPGTIELGENVNFEIVVSNVGTGVASNVTLLESIPDGLFHPSGTILDNKIGDLQAGESKKLPLTLKAASSGITVNKLTVSADNLGEQTVETEVRVVAPELKLEIQGPSNLYLEQSTSFKMLVNNVGEAAAHNVRLMVQLPQSLTFVQANNLGAYKEDEHCVYWDLAELPPQTNGEILLTVKSTKPDNVDLVFEAVGPNNLSAHTSKKVSIDGLAALSFTISSSADLVRLGSDYEYTVEIVNRGTKASSNVELQIMAPSVVSILATDGPTQATNRKGVIVFDKVPEIAPKSTITYRIKASASQQGDCRVGFQLSSDDLEPLVQENNTRVYE